MSWRVAGSLLQLRKQVDAMAPNRSKASDGTIGDAAHRASKSEHNPDERGIVRAMDITDDPRNGVDAGKFARKIAGDRRILYVISNAEISNPSIAGGAWRKYTGKNPHNHHFHVSVRADLCDDETPWSFDGVDVSPRPDLPKVIDRPVLRRGDKGDSVKILQRLLTGLIVDGDFGRQTEAAVKAFQKRRKLFVDAVVGQYTWAALEGK